MRSGGIVAVAIILAACIAGCGVAYQAGTRIKAERMSEKLQVGESSLAVHNQFGEPDLRSYPDSHSEIWSYPYKPNSNDVTAALLYTSSKEGDSGTFLDLKFVDGKLVNWSETQHTMPSKERAGFGAGFGSAPLQPPAGAHY